MERSYEGGVYILYVCPKLMIWGIDQIVNNLYTGVKWDKTAWSVWCCATLLAVENLGPLQDIV